MVKIPSEVRLINVLLDDLENLLTTELVAVSPQVRIERSPLAQVKNLQLPAIALYPQALTLIPDPQQQPDTDHAYREFQQTFCLEVESTDASQAEKLMSLSFGILTLKQNQLLQPFQRSPETDETFTHTSANIGTIHRLRQLQVRSAEPVSSTDTYRWQIQGMVSGHLYMTYLEPQSQVRLSEVTVKSRLPQVESPEVSRVAVQSQSG